MKSKITEKEWLEDFKCFVKCGEGVKVPEDLSKQILDQVYSAMNPSPWWVFFKLLGVHLVVGTLSLALCDQFGISPFNTGFSLVEYFMMFGHSVCMTLCGFLFIGLTVILSATILYKKEVIILKKNAYLQIPTLSMLSVGIFMVFGAEMAVGIGLLWFLGAVVGGFCATQFISQIKKYTF
jgi:hypothetical protein